MNKSLSVNFGLIIRDLRLKQDLTQEQLGYRAGIHRTYVGMIERGEKNITLENIDKICNALHITMELVFHKLKELD